MHLGYGYGKGLGVILEDTFGRRFYYLRLSITDLCNFRCNYCLPDGIDCSKPADYLNVREIETLVAAFARLGTCKVRLTGGEPTLRHDLTDIIQLCKQTPGIQKVALTTNGLNLASKAGEFKQAGLDAVNISADSLDPRMFATITGRDKLDQVLKGLDAAIEAKISSIKINTVLLRQFNQQEIHTFLRFVKSKKVTWRFIELMQTGDNSEFFHENHFQGQLIKQQLIQQGWQPVIKAKDAGPGQEFQHPEYAGRVGLIMPYSKDFCNSCNRLRVSALGKLHLCLFADQGFDLRTALQAGNVAATRQLIQSLVQGKLGSHSLQRGFTGATRQLAMLGG